MPTLSSSEPNTTPWKSVPAAIGLATGIALIILLSILIILFIYTKREREEEERVRVREGVRGRLRDIGRERAGGEGAGGDGGREGGREGVGGEAQMTPWIV